MSLKVLGGLNTSMDNGLKSMGKPLKSGFPDWMYARESEIVEQREATFLAHSHRKIAIQNIAGGVFPEFDNDNLYGFAIFTFTGGWDSGWNVLDVKSMLQSNVVGNLTGGDDIANVTNYFFNVHPKAISLSEPNATHIIPTQNNGFYIESQGIVLRRMSISGTTGFRPSRRRLSEGGLLPNNNSEPTGFLNHIKLRNLFRNYSNLKKNPKTAKNSFLVWYNGYTQEAWFCEPESFNSSKDASSPFISRYEIGVTLLQKIAFSAINVKLSPGLMGPQFMLESVRLGAVMLNREGIPAWMKTVKEVATGVTNLIDTAGEFIKTAESYATNAVGFGGAFAGTFIALGAGLMQSVKNVAFSTKSIVETGANLGISFTGGTESPFVKSWIDIGNDIQSSFISTLRSTNSLLMWCVEERGNTASAKLEKDNAAYGGFKSYPNQIPEDYTYIEGIVPDNINTVEDILWIHNCDPNTKPLVWTVNNMEYPYISNIPSGNTLAPGDIIYLPGVGGKIPENIETKLFPMNIKLGLYEELLGRDIRINEIETGAGQKSFNFVIDDKGDLDLIESRDNMKQAIYIKLNVERGELPLHPGFGLVDVVGMKSTLNLSFATNLAINDTMLSDGRIESLSGLTIQTSGDVSNVSLNAHIIGNNTVVPLAFSLGG